MKTNHACEQSRFLSICWFQVHGRSTLLLSFCDPLAEGHPTIDKSVGFRVKKDKFTILQNPKNSQV